MKKVFSLFATALLLCGFLMPAMTSAGVEGQIKDQYYDDTSSFGGAMVVGPSTYNRAQTFRPTVSKITSVDVYLTDQLAGKRLNLMIKKESDGTIVSNWHSSTNFVGGNGWVTISYDSPYVSVVPETEYGIYLAITGDLQTKWAWKNGNPYTRGMLKGFLDNDGLFVVMGIPPASVPAVTNSGSEQTESVVGGTTTAIAVDASVKEPVISYIVKDKVRTDAPFKKDIIVGKGSDITLYGTSFAGAKVAIFIDEKGYEATVGPDGNWSYKANLSALEGQIYAVTAQAQNTAGKGSAIVELAKLKVVVPVGTGKAEKLSGWFVGWNIFYILVPVGLLLLILLLLALITRRHHQEAKKEEEKVEKKEPTSTNRAKKIKNKKIKK